MKTCSKCLSLKNCNEFTRDKGQKDGFYPSCKDCKKQLYTLKAKQISNKNSEYQRVNKVKIATYQASYRKEKLQNDPYYRLSLILRCRLNSAIKNKIKSGSAISDLGCSIEFFKDYIESKFEPGMTWDNHIKFGWHIDHIRPLASFDLSDPNQIKLACHYTNLQPLWWKDNLVKSKKMENL